MLSMMRAVLSCALAALLLAACGDDAPENRSPSELYEIFFEELGKGNTDQALEELAPEGALGDTFQAAAYYMLAKEFEDQQKAHGAIDDVIIDREEALSEDEVMIQGRIRFRNGEEMPRDIRFTRENDRWVGRI